MVGMLSMVWWFLCLRVRWVLFRWVSVSFLCLLCLFGSVGGWVSDYVVLLGRCVSVMWCWVV